MSKNEKPLDDLSSMIDSMLASSPTGVKNRTVVDIITFCEDPKYLNFLGQDPKIALWDMQKIVLKLFYRGTRGNEHLQLTEDEVKILEGIGKSEDLDYMQEFGGFGQVVDKYRRWNIHNTFLLIMGRRSSKTMMTSIIAAYEAYKLLETPEGNPQKFYKMAPDKEIHIVNLAVSEKQAFILFAEIRARLAQSPYFLDKMNPLATRAGEICLLTDEDKRINQERIAKGIKILRQGSVVLTSGHSNSATLRGLAAIAILFDEFAHFQNSSGKSSGDAVYGAMAPSVKQFGLDGKIVMLSDPGGKDDMFWKLFEMSQIIEKNEKSGIISYPYDNILAIQLPTWCINPNKDFTKESLERTEKAKDAVHFLTSYGAKFVGTEGAKFFDPQKVEACIEINMQEPRFGNPAFRYYIHLDPATTSHNYALVMVHSVPYTNKQNEIKRKIFVDCVKVWTPDGSGPVDLRHVEKIVRELCGRFPVASVTYDTFQSAQTIQNLKSFGINAFETPYRTGYITQIYGELRNLVNAGDLVLYPHPRLIGEMKSLNYKILARGFQRSFDSKSEFPSDDCVDALAGAVFQAIQKNVIQALPRSGVVYTGRR